MEELINLILKEYKEDFDRKGMFKLEIKPSKFNSTNKLDTDVFLTISYKVGPTRFHDTFHVGEREFYSMIYKKRLSEMYQIENGFPAITKTLFDQWLKDKVSSTKLRIKEFKNIYPYWFKIMDMKKFLSLYTSDELIQIYQYTGNDLLLPETVKDIFLF